MSDLKISLFEMVLSLSSLIDLVNPDLVGHHKRVAYIAHSLSTEIGLSAGEKNDLVMAALLHDTGALSLKERFNALHFEFDNPNRHAELGYRLLGTFTYFEKAAALVKFHHIPWNFGEGSFFNGNPVPFGSHIIHLADRIDVLIDHKSEIIGQVGTICDMIKSYKGWLFQPELVDAFLGLSKKEAFWLDISYLPEAFRQKLDFGTIVLNEEELLDIAYLFEKVIDFRSRFTATHSSGVASVAEALAGICGMKAEQCNKMKIAGYLHDLGKLAVPAEILEKPGKLTQQEVNIIKTHTYFTYQVLDNIGGFEDINQWASFHHEFLNGGGYPFRLKSDEIPLGSRIMSIADVFTAITEDRPYRKGFEAEQAIAIMADMSKSEIVDREILSTLLSNYNQIDSIRKTAQAKAEKDYVKFLEGV